MIRIRTLILRLLRVPCGGYGGQLFDGTTRWCFKAFAHSDSCAWDATDAQPLERERQRAKGWDS